MGCGHQLTMLGPRSAFWGECVHLWLTRKGLYFLEHYFIITKAPNTVHVDQHQKHASLVHQLGLKPLPLRCWNRPVGVIASNTPPPPPSPWYLHSEWRVPGRPSHCSVYQMIGPWFWHMMLSRLGAGMGPGSLSPPLCLEEDGWRR